MKLTFKAIARAAGYRVESGWLQDPKSSKMQINKYWFWINMDDASYPSSMFGELHGCEDSAWEGCCVYNNLVILENE